MTVGLIKTNCWVDGWADGNGVHIDGRTTSWHETIALMGSGWKMVHFAPRYDSWYLCARQEYTGKPLTLLVDERDLAYIRARGDLVTEHFKHMSLNKFKYAQPAGG